MSVSFLLSINFRVTKIVHKAGAPSVFVLLQISPSDLLRVAAQPIKWCDLWKMSSLLTPTASFRAQEHFVFVFYIDPAPPQKVPNVAPFADKGRAYSFGWSSTLSMGNWQ